MAALTNSGAEVLGQGLDTNGEEVQPPAFPLDVMYETQRCVEWIKSRDYQRVCLQFPDELLCEARRVCSQLTHLLGQQRISVLADTTYGSCCVDEVAAQHIGADAVIHFGRTCLSPPNFLPVLYIPTRLAVSVHSVVEGVCVAMAEMERGERSEHILLFSDSRCYYAQDSIATAFKPTFPNLVTTEMLFDRDFIPTGGSGGNDEDVAGSGGGNVCCGGDNSINACGGDVNGGVGRNACSYGGGGGKLCCKKNAEVESECHIYNKVDSEATNGENEDKSECHIQNNSVSEPPSSENDSDVNEVESEYQIPRNTQDSDVKNEGQDEGESKCHIPRHTQGSTTISFVGRRVTIPDGAVFTDYRCVYVGPPGPSLTTLLFRFPQSIFYQVDPQSGKVSEMSGTKLVMSRSVKVELARDARIIGLLVGTLGVSGYKHILDRLHRIITLAGKRCYKVVVGKPNEPKLANFHEIDAFVHIACPEATVVLMGTDPALARRLLAPWELEVALLPVREWRLALETDFRALLPGGERHIRVQEEDFQEQVVGVSLRSQQHCVHTIGGRGGQGMDENSGVMVVQDGRLVSSLHHGGGGEMLARREWGGLDPSIPPLAPTGSVVEGLHGVAARYTHEK